MKEHTIQLSMAESLSFLKALEKYLKHSHRKYSITDENLLSGTVDIEQRTFQINPPYISSRVKSFALYGYGKLVTHEQDKTEIQLRIKPYKPQLAVSIISWLFSLFCLLYFKEFWIITIPLALILAIVIYQGEKKSIAQQEKYITRIIEKIANTKDIDSIL